MKENLTMSPGITKDLLLSINVKNKLYKKLLRLRTPLKILN